MLVCSSSLFVYNNSIADFSPRSDCRTLFQKYSSNVLENVPVGDNDASILVAKHLEIAINRLGTETNNRV